MVLERVRTFDVLASLAMFGLQGLVPLGLLSSMVSFNSALTSRSLRVFCLRYAIKGASGWTCLNLSDTSWHMNH